ncbi:MAG: hypothetical protein ACW98K_01495 [Candidatus Kariarchaeaceae archaeon]
MSHELTHIKLVLIGDSRVGKTSLRKRYMGEGFRGSYSATIGADFSVRVLRDKKITIYDLAGVTTHSYAILSWDTGIHYGI